MRDSLILRIVSKFMIPVIVLFALYVQFHGELGPGGGFQAGVILAAALILHMLVFGLDETQRIAPIKVLRRLSAAGVLIYGGTGVISLFRGADFLDYNVLASTPVGGQHLGIFLIEIGVAVTVASTLLMLSFVFAARVRQP